jgi:hypothetical protein
MKFSIRDLLLLTVIVALVLGWWLDSRDRERRMRKEVREEVERVYSILDNRAASLNPPKK